MPYRVLIAAASDEMLQSYAKLIEKHFNGIEVLMAGNVIEACRAAASEYPDSILIEYSPGFFKNITQKLNAESITAFIPKLAVLSTPDKIETACTEEISDWLHPGMTDKEKIFRISRCFSFAANAREKTASALHKKRLLINTEDIELVTSQTSNSVAVIDRNGVILWTNKAFGQLYNQPRFEPDGVITIFDLKNDEDIQTQISNCLSLNETIRFTSAIDKGDFQQWVQTTLNPINRGNQVDWIAIVEDDITRLKETELELEQKTESMVSLNEYLENANNQLEAQKQEIDQQREAIEDEKQKFENLLSEILPFEVARQLISKGEVKPKSFKTVTVMFTDFKGFSKISANLPPEELVKILHGYFARFDDIISKHFIEKIKTIGDAYMCVGGLPLRNKSNPFNVVIAGLEIQRYMNELNDKFVLEGQTVWELRLGIHTGEVVAGVVGKKKFAYDIWGDTVNIAARMETSGHVGMVNISGATYEYIKDYFECTYRGAIEVKNRGEIDMYFVHRIKPEFSVDGKGFEPNEDFIKFLNKL